ncbi:hypothetical protein E1297_06245 [Roseibium sp. RKSG952]|nr:hypothetical protein [Roseibium sp. RKSG952]
MKTGIIYEFNHMGIPTRDIRPNERFSAEMGMYTSDHEGQFPLQWHRFTETSPLHPLLKTMPHLAYKVSDLDAAIKGKDLLLGPYEPIDGYHVAVINDGGMPIELIETKLSDEEVRARAKAGKGAIYRKPESGT